MTRGKKTERKCRNCGCIFTARVADVNRGWAKFCSKSCKAKAQEERTHQYRDYNERNHDNDCGHFMQSGMFGHGQW